MDRAKIETFLERFLEFASGATTVGLLAVADRSGLTRYLDESGGGTADELARGAALQTRYVEEILSGLAAAGVVDYEPESGRFNLPAEHALFLSDDSSPYFMGGFLDLLPAVLAQVDRVAVATAQGGGVGFEEYGDVIIRGIDRGNTPSQRTFLIPKWLPAVPGLVPNLEKGIRVADVGCGSGTAALLMGEAFPKSQVIGFDVSPESIAVARGRADHADNVDFLGHDVTEIPTEPPFGLITSFDVIHDLADPLAGLRRIRESLADDGVYLMMEPNAGSKLEDNLDPRGAMLYGISTLHCMTQSLARGGVGLGAAWGRERAEELAGQAGFGTFRPLDEITNRFSAFFLLSR